MKKIKFSFWIFTALILLQGCHNKQDNLSFLVENSSQDVSEVDLLIFVDDDLLINEYFRRKLDVPDYDVYHFKLADGQHTLKVKSKSQGIEMTKKFKLPEDRYIFINFKYKTLKGKAYEFEKGLSDSLKVPFDSVLIPKKIEVWITDKMPKLH
ncbi:hypothetical protein [Microscilla marina]|uniref:Lipoprotein, putative n=1 Tax=Microscilla marina ATCC 23134 TaxID=313606 RepID=A2A0E3_MICM2|nr:hypothetical protein [Microscilla marina]EAY23898.1 lipoprotein, putative [Microscilla marina ATCC 23134]